MLALAIAGVMVLIVVAAAIGRSVYLGHIGDVVAPAVAAALLAWLSLVQIDGQTGDVLGAVEQVGEIVVLLVALL